MTRRGSTAETMRSALGLLMDLARRDGVVPLSGLPGAWTRQIDEDWWVAMNGQPHPVTVTSRDGPAVVVEPYETLVLFNGWPWAHWDLAGRGEVGHGPAANAGTFCAALRRAMA